MTTWTIEHTSGDAGPFHRRPDPVDPAPAVWVHRVLRPALVLGSSQPDDAVDGDRARAEGVEVCRRRSGGGLVHLIPGDHCWIDLVIPTSSRLWDADVGRAFHWVGAAWAAALAEVLADVPADVPAEVPADGPLARSVHGPGDPTDGAAGPEPGLVVHDGPLLRRAEGRQLCFAGLGAGEVTIDHHGERHPGRYSGRYPGRYKVVGLSQRRWRTGARFQGVALWHWRPERLVPYASPAVVEVARARRAIGLPRRADGARVTAPPTDRVVAALVAHLPTP